MPAVQGAGCRVVWDDGSPFVEKRYDHLSRPWFEATHRKFERELRVGTLLRRQPPPVRHARLVSADRRRRVLRFERVAGEPLGPKFPLALDGAGVALLVSLASLMAEYRPHAPFATRFDLRRRLARAVQAGALTPDDALRLLSAARADPPALVFGHGDITARNVLLPATEPGSPVLIDWEWAGRYPRGWDLAFVWFSLVDVPGGREQVEAAVPEADEPWFWRSALLIQALHLGFPGFTTGNPFLPRHVETRDELLRRVARL